jgi:hypothetical protein
MCKFVVTTNFACPFIEINLLEQHIYHAAGAGSIPGIGPVSLIGLPE